MVDVEIETPNRPFAAQLRQRLSDGGDAETLEARSLMALASVSPAAAFDTLLTLSEAEDGSVGGTTLVGDPEISAAIVIGLRGLRRDAPARDFYASALLRRFCCRLTVAAAIEAVGAVSALKSREDFAALDKLLARFPLEPDILRAAIRTTQSLGERLRTDALLTRLGLADPTPATVAFVHRARDTSGTLETHGQAAASARVALVSSYTIDALVPFVDLECRARGIVPAIYVAPFNSWTRDVIDPASGLRAFVPDITFLSVSIDDLVPELVGSLDGPALEAAADSALQRVLAVVDGYLEWATGKPLVVHRFHSAFAGPLGILDGSTTPARIDWLAALNARLAAALRERPGCHALDVVGAVTIAAGSLADNPKLRHIAAMRLPPTALSGVAAAYVRYIVPARGLAKKCIVLDLDNTLWGGVVGEDGKDGIRLSTTGQGAEFVEFQTFLRALTERGILLAVNSKNNPDDALEVIRLHEAMVLRESAFSALRINWQPKSENMLEIARDLNIGLESLIFIDDNPDERDRMRQMLPEILTVEMPRDPTQYRATLEALPELQSLAITTEDRARVGQYETARLRSQAKTETGDVTTYLQSLEICVAIQPIARATYSRVTQLFAKTNQFNTTTRRYVLADVEGFAANPSLRLWTLASRDRFGDHGLVAVALVRVDSPVWEIDSFLMSCRVIGYGIETALLAHVVEAARAGGARALQADFIKTKKNAPAHDLYARHGFTTASGTDTVERWTHSLTDELPFPTWIERSI